MLTVLVFIGLKLAEILALCVGVVMVFFMGLPFSRLFAGHWWPENWEEGILFFLLGVITIGSVFLLVVFLGPLLLTWIQSNWDWAKQIVG